MTDITRRTIGELLARYELEPTLKDVFVEGTFDRDVLFSCYRGAKELDLSFYEIDSVDVPVTLLAKNGLSDGNKQRVIALSRELAKLPPECSCKCLVDRDLDHWFGVLEVTDRLVWTEFCSLELYYFTDEILHDILITTAKTRIHNWQGYIESLIAVLRTLYAIRLTDRELNWSLKLLPIDRCLSTVNSLITFDSVEYIDRLLKKNQRILESARFHASLTAWQAKLSCDHRFCIRGHDFVELLAWSIGKFRGVKEFASKLTIERLFVLLAPKVQGLMRIMD